MSEGHFARFTYPFLLLYYSITPQQQFGDKLNLQFLQTKTDLLQQMSRIKFVVCFLMWSAPPRDNPAYIFGLYRTD